jgi:thioredoxin:protein disulfide reductase
MLFMKKILTGAVAFFLLSGFFIWGAGPIVSVQAIAPADPLKAGKMGTLTVELTIPGPYHINSNKPLDNNFIPTKLEFDRQPHVIFGNVIFPPAPPKKLPVNSEPMSVFEGTVDITAEIIPDMSLAGSEITIKGKVYSQACNDSACFPPVWQPFSLTMPVVSSAQPSAETQPIISAEPALPPKLSLAASPVGNSGASGNLSATDFSNKNLLIVFLSVFLGGLLLNLTPCIYPMIPITITYFGGQAKGKKGSLFIHSCLYVFGMAVMYSILGVVAAMTGGLFGAALRYPPVLIGIALVMAMLALSMFDVYELRMPAFLNRLAGGSQKGFGGTLLMGLTVGIIAAPCIGPFVLGLLTYVGDRGDIILGFSLFFVLALGMGIPFLILGLFSGSLHRLPRSGAWMVWVRKIFGFILLAMAVYFLKSLFPSPLSYRLALALMMLLAGIYLAWIDPVPAVGRVFPLVRNIVGMLFFIAAWHFAVTGLQSGIGTASMNAVRPNSIGSIQWIPYSDAMLSQAAREAKPVFIDFYADWCAPCKELDEDTFAAPEVIDRSRKFIMLKADLTSTGDPQVEALRQKFQARGMPTLIFLKPDGEEIVNLRGTGFESKDIFLDKMKHALDLSAKQITRQSEQESIPDASFQ